MDIAWDLVFILFGVTMLPLATCFSDGSFLEDECQGMNINHNGITAQDSDPPFKVIPEEKTFTDSEVGTSITVQLAAVSSPFIGFMLEAHKCDDCPPAGTFSVLEENTVLICEGKALSHTDNLDKTSIKVSWRVPEAGTFFFRAAFTQSFSVFWRRKQIIYTTTAPTTSGTTIPITATAKTTTAITATTNAKTTTAITATAKTTTDITATTTAKTTTAITATANAKTTTDITATTTAKTTTAITATTNAKTTTAITATANAKTTTDITATANAKTTTDITATANAKTTTAITATANAKTTTAITATTSASTATSQTITSNTTETSPPQCVDYMRSVLGLLFISRLCFLGGSSLLIIIRLGLKMVTIIVSVFELLSKIAAVVLVLIRANKVAFIVLTVIAMVSSLLHNITIFLYCGPSHELRKCWLCSFIMANVPNTCITTAAIFVGLWCFEGHWLLILMGVYVFWEITLFLSSVSCNQMEKYQIIKQNREVHILEKRIPPWFIVFLVFSVVNVMFTIALITGVSFVRLKEF